MMSKKRRMPDAGSASHRLDVSGRRTNSLVESIAARPLRCVLQCSLYASLAERAAERHPERPGYLLVRTAARASSGQVGNRLRSDDEEEPANSSRTANRDNCMSAGRLTRAE